MHNELTRQDLKMMREELDYRRITLRPKLLEAVKEARAFGDLSENFEYKAAKQEKNRNESRIRFLENMIKTAKVFDDTSGADQVGLYDKVTVYMEDDDETEVYQIVTTMRQDRGVPDRHHHAPGCAQRSHQQGVPGGPLPVGKAGGGPGPHPGERELRL